MFVQIASAKDPILVSLMQSEILTSGLHPNGLRTISHFTIAGSDQFYFLEVPLEEAVPARKVLEETGFAKYLIQ